MIASVKEAVFWRLVMGTSSLALERCNQSNFIWLSVVLWVYSNFQYNSDFCGLGVSRRNISYLPSGRVLGRFLRNAGYNFVYANAETIVHDEHFAPGDQLLIDQDIDGITGQFIEFDDVAIG